MNIQRNEWTVFSIYQRHSPSISFADRSCNERLEDRDGNQKRHGEWREREKKKINNRRMRYRVLPTRGEKIFIGKKDCIWRERERERTINHKEWETRRGSWLRRGINLNYVVSRRRDRDSIDRDEATDTRHVIRDHATDRARSNNFQGGSFRRKCAERRSSSLHYRCLALSCL